MLGTRTHKITAALRRTQWELILDGLAEAGFASDGPGWCFCPEADGNDICRACGEREDRAYEYRELAAEITRMLGDRHGLITLAFSASTWAILVCALTEGATHIVDSLGYDCVRARADRMCADCVRASCTADAIRVHGARIARRVKRTPARPTRAPRRPRGTRASRR
ncbi:hypothetical protein [Nonomuraea sp. NPDC052265]|uniref:hypothetical protein n=1 Tax=Nonomuraea sp. NPDC052265 TaxID=3364374 RepID=UPI0037C6EF14